MLLLIDDRWTKPCWLGFHTSSQAAMILHDHQSRHQNLLLKPSCLYSHEGCLWISGAKISGSGALADLCAVEERKDSLKCKEIDSLRTYGEQMHVSSCNFRRWKRSCRCHAIACPSLCMHAVIFRRTRAVAAVHPEDLKTHQGRPRSPGHLDARHSPADSQIHMLKLVHASPG